MRTKHTCFDLCSMDLLVLCRFVYLYPLGQFRNRAIRLTKAGVRSLQGKCYRHQSMHSSMSSSVPVCTELRLVH